jgi:hypothetical protein
MSQATEPKRRGRKPLPADQRKPARPVCTVRLSDEERAALAARGGWPAFRAWLREPLPS